MGVEPPFIYDRPSTYSFAGPTDKGFNPRAATQGSWTPKPARPPKDGPLVEFNRHPDSYLLVPYGNLTAKPMPPNTKTQVNNARNIQLGFRVLQVIGALGMLFCVIAINKTSSSIGWIIRLTPAVTIVHTVYGVYHLCRAPQCRTPASTASYMLFATMIDVGLLPFLVFSALLAHSDYTSNAYGWSTLFNISATSYKVIYSYFLLNVVEGGMMVISLLLGIYLATLFRKIAKLPPDMNPLEPNLTSRPLHKRNKSDLTLTESTTDLSKNKLSNTADSMIAGRRVPFMHTRTDSADSVTLYGNPSARQSRADISNEKGAFAAEYEVEGHSRPASAVNPSANTRAAGAGLDYKPARSSGLAPKSKTNSWMSYMDFEGVPRTLSVTANRALDQAVRPLSPVSPMVSREPTPELYAEKNWYQSSARNSTQSLHQPVQPTTASPEASPSRQRQSNTHDLQNDRLQVPQTKQKRSREPLGMNPPTPPIEQYANENDEMYTPPQRANEHFDGHKRYALHDADVNLTPHPQQGSRSSSFVGSGTKARFYGNIQGSMGSTNNLNTHPADDDDNDSASDYSRTRTMETVSSNIEVYAADEDEPVYGTARVIQQGASWNGARQVSNTTSYDLNKGYAGLGTDFGKGMGRRREVSGKVAEEGRGAAYGGAQGWARFKGL